MSMLLERARDSFFSGPADGDWLAAASIYAESVQHLPQEEALTARQSVCADSQLPVAELVGL